MSNLERLRATDTLLLGATTYMGLTGYWPAVAENPELSPAVANNPDVAYTVRLAGATTVKFGPPPYACPP